MNARLDIDRAKLQYMDGVYKQIELTADIALSKRWHSFLEKSRMPLPLMGPNERSAIVMLHDLADLHNDYMLGSNNVRARVLYLASADIIDPASDYGLVQDERARL